MIKTRPINGIVPVVDTPLTAEGFSRTQDAASSAGPQVVTSLLTGLLISLVFTALLTIYYSHRVAGPMHHLKMHLQKMIDGDFSRDLNFRERDEFRNIAVLINTLQNRLKNGFPT